MSRNSVLPGVVVVIVVANTEDTKDCRQAQTKFVQ